MLPCVCSVIDHRWRQNVVRTNKWHTRRSRVCHWCSYHILTSSVIYHWIRRTATWNLFVLYNNEKPFLFQNISTWRESRPFCPAFAPPLPRLHLARKKAIWRDLMIQKWSNFIGCYGVAKNRNWSRKIAPLSNLTRASLLVEWKLTAKAELNCEIYNSWTKFWKNKSVVVIGAAPWAEKLGRCPENYRSWKTTLGKLVVTVNLEAIWIRVLN